MGEPPGAPRPAPASRSAVLVALLMAALATAPYARATASPPRGTAFTGYFWFTDDAYNYLSYVQQAEDGALVFRNKLVPTPHPPALVNPEWWVVGVLSRLLGREPVLAYRIFAVGAIFALVSALAVWLRDCGLPRTHLPAALLLVCLGGGGGAACLWLGRPVQGCLDISAGLFPFLEMLANPHFVAGTALLLWSMRAFRIAGETGGARRLVAAGALGTVLALTRPYDLVLLVAVRSIVVAVAEPPRLWLRHAAAMAVLLPVVAYDAWVFYRVPAFASLAAIRYVFPGVGEFIWALGPAAVVGAGARLAARARGAALLPPAADRPARVAALHFVVWLGLAVLVIAVHPVNFSLQFLVGVGVPLLVLAALALASFGPRVTFAATAALGSALVAALRITFLASPSWYVPAERLAVARALRGPCRPGDVLVSPPDIGRYAGALSACTPFVSHAAAPGFEERAAEVRRFYQSPGALAGDALLDRACAAHVVAPAEAPFPADLADASFLPSRTVGPIAIYSRKGGLPCPAR